MVQSPCCFTSAGLQKVNISRLLLVASPPHDPWGFKFPELDFFDLHPGALLHCGRPSVFKAHSLQYAMRICLGRKSCTGLQWEEAPQTLRLCESQPANASGLNQRPGAAVFAALRKRAVYELDREARAGARECGEGEALVLGKPRGTCSICREGYCR
jgi:hypothetical protein